MSSESTLIDTGDARVTLARGDEGAALLVVNDDGRVRVPLSDDQAEGLARAEPGGAATPETERKLLVDRMPPHLDRAPHQRLRQGYLAVSDTASLRIRETGGRAKLTVKRGVGLTRTEVELEVSDLQASLLWPLAGRRRVDKTRYVLLDPVLGDGRPLELDVYHGAHEGLVMVEREFDDPEAARAWTPPPWAGREVTDDPRYTNAQLALQGRTPDESTPAEASSTESPSR